MAAERTVEAHRRQDLALRLHLAGATYAEIAASKDPQTGKQLYATPSSAHRAVKEAKARATEGADEAVPVDQARALEVERLDRLQRALWPAAMSGDVGAVREVRQIVLARARLLGADVIAPAEPEKPKEDAVDDLAARRAARRSAAANQ